MYEQNETEKPHSEYVQRKSLCQLVYKKLEDIGTITAKQYQEVLKKAERYVPDVRIRKASFQTDAAGLMTAVIECERRRE